MTILVFFGALAGLLAALGVYGLFSWSVALRTRELAIRLTLGANPRRSGARVGQSAMLVAPASSSASSSIQARRGALTRVLYGVSPSDAASSPRPPRAAAGRGARRVHAAGAARDARRSGGGLARRVRTAGMVLSCSRRTNGSEQRAVNKQLG